MAFGFVIRKGQYYDSVFLMRIARTLGDEPGVQQAAVVMATEANKELLVELGFSSAAIQAAGPNDLLAALSALDEATVERLLAEIDGRLQSLSAVSARPARFRSLDEAALAAPQSRLAVVSVPGNYAAREVQRALELGKHVFVFSNNVSVEDEVKLKQSARQRGLLVMGPDCGTSLIGGAGIGFANVVNRGPIGVVGASGTGIQEFTSLVHRAGSGISHAIGTGSHDLSDAVGGITTLMALDALEADPGTRLIALVSKPAGAETLERVVGRLRACRKPVVACFLGLQRSLGETGPAFQQARSIDQAVRLALLGVGVRPPAEKLAEKSRLAALAGREAARWRPGRRYLRGLFAGGTFCFQAQQVLADAGIAVYSNSPLDRRYRLENPAASLEHSVIDLGDDLFTQGRPHPMIDATQRRRRLLAEADDPETAVILLDFILGHMASPDPAGDLIAAIRTARAKGVTVVASICGTGLDPQGYDRQRALLEEAGVFVFESSAGAATFCAALFLAAEGASHEK